MFIEDASDTKAEQASWYLRYPDLDPDISEEKVSFCTFIRLIW